MSRRKQPGGRPSGFLLALAMVVAMAAYLLPGVSTPAFAEDPHTHDNVTFVEWTNELAQEQNGSSSTAATSLPSKEGNYYLTDNVKLSGAWKSPAGTTNLCLNDRVVRYTGEGASSVIEIGEGAKLNLFGGDENTGIITGGKGSGVVVMGGTFTMHGGIVTTNKSMLGGGVCVVEGGKFTMDAGRIEVNEASDDQVGGLGGGVYVGEGSEFTMNGGSITKNHVACVDNTTPIKGGFGAGVYLAKGSNFTMNGGSITNNNAARFGGGVYDGGTLSISGNSEISGNTNIHIGEPIADNVYLVRDAVVNVADELINAKPIGITMQDADVFTSGKASGYADKFASDDERYTVAVRGDELMLQHLKHGMSYYPSGATVTAECAWPSSCSLPDGKVALTIKAPTLAVYGGTGSAAATLEGLADFNEACGLSLAEKDIKYYKATADGDAYTKGDPLPAAPTDAGDYLAEIPVRTDTGGDEDSAPSYVTVSVGYTIHKADPAVDNPGPLSGTKGDLLESVKLPEVKGGTWSWEADPGARLENAGECVFSATFTPDDTANYTTIVGVPVIVNVAAAPEPGRIEMFRLYNPYTGEHFYTASEVERDFLVGAGWSFEGVGWVAPTEGAPVFRLYNPYVGDHHYTTSELERDYLVSVGWNDEGVGWRSAESDGVPLWRQYNPYASVGTHNYTASEAERDMLVSVGWRHEGIGWYGLR